MQAAKFGHDHGHATQSGSHSGRWGTIPRRCIMPDRAEVGYHPILNIQPIAYFTYMKNHIIVTCVAMSALALSILLVGCDRKVSSEKTSTVSSDGTVKSKEKTVTKSSDGTVTKTDESKKTTPPEKP
jgi:hypothetical protein